MTLEELVSKVKVVGTDMVSIADQWIMDALAWQQSGMVNLFSGNIMLLTLSQVAFTAFLAFGLCLQLQEWYVGLRDFFSSDGESKDNP